MDITVAADIERAARVFAPPRQPDAVCQILDGSQIRESHEEGISYLEVSDNTGRVQVAIAYAAGVFWALHVGYPSARVSLPNWRLKLPEGADSTVIYTGPIFSLIRFSEGHDAVWWIHPQQRGTDLPAD